MAAKRKKKPAGAAEASPGKKKAGSKPKRTATEASMAAIKLVANPHKWWHVLLATLSGCMVFLSYPNYDLFPLQWFALVPLLYVIEGKRAWPAFGWGLLAGFVTNWGGFWWVTGMLMDFGHFSLFVAIPLCSLLCAYQGLVFAFWAMLTRWLVDRTNAPLLLVAPVVWVFVEYSLPFIFPWYLANGQYLFYPAIQMVELTGVLGLSFLLVLVNVGLYLGVKEALKKRWNQAWKPVAFVAAFFAANVLYGVVRIGQVDELMAASETLRIGVGEANVGIFEKEAKDIDNPTLRQNMLRSNILKHHILAAEIDKQKADLIVLPESSFIPVSLDNQPVRFKRNDTFAVVAGTGSAVWERRDQSWSGPIRTVRDATVVTDVYAAREDEIFAVGPNGLIMRRQGEEWTREAAPEARDLNGVWAQEITARVARLDGLPVVAMAVGEKGAAFLRRPKAESREGEWEVTETRTPQRLNAVTGNGRKNIIAVGERGIVLRWTGTGWQRERTNVTTALNDVQMTLGGSAVAVGQNGVVLKRSGTSWIDQSIPRGPTLLAAAYAQDGILVAGEGGAIWRRSQQKWVVEKTPTQRTLHGLSSDGRGLLYAVGDGGTVLTRNGHIWASEPALRGAGDLRAVAGVPYTEAHTFARDSKHVYRSQSPLPDLGGRSAVEAVDDIGAMLAGDTGTPGRDWNTPLRGFDTPILLGVLSYEPVDPNVTPLYPPTNRRSYNSAMLLDPRGRVLGRTDKNYLLIFGEYIPFGDVFPKLYEWLPEASHFYPGETVETFEVNGHHIGVMICYEDIIPRFTRKLAGKDPNVLINVTNDAWFGKTPEPYLHLALATFRAVENRLWLIRSTNTGVSAYVDAVGRIVAETGLEDPEILVEDVPMLRTSTLYRSYGELFAYVCLLVFALLCVGALARRRRRKAQA